MEARDHVRTWMTDDTEVDDLRCEVRSSHIHTARFVDSAFSSAWLPLSLLYQPLGASSMPFNKQRVY